MDQTVNLTSSTSVVRIHLCPPLRHTRKERIKLRCVCLFLCKTKVKWKITVFADTVFVVSSHIGAVICFLLTWRNESLDGNRKSRGHCTKRIVARSTSYKFICRYGLSICTKYYLLRAVILSAICRCCSVRPCIIIMFSYCLHVFSGGFGKVRAVFFERRQSACFYNNRRESATFRRWQPAVAG